MVNIEMALIVAFGLLNAFLIVSFGAWTMKTMIRGLAELDMRVSEAITTLVSDAVENFTPELEPVNPIVSIFAYRPKMRHFSVSRKVDEISFFQNHRFL